MLAKRFFYVCAGILCLALAYHLGARNAGAQAPDSPVVTGVNDYAFTANGDVYRNVWGDGATWEYRGDVFTGGPTNVQQESWGQLKQRYRDPEPEGGK